MRKTTKRMAELVRLGKAELLRRLTKAGINADPGAGVLWLAGLAEDAESPRRPRAKKADAPRYKYQEYYHGEALYSKSLGRLVRFLRWEGGSAAYADMVLAEQPGRLAPDDLERPSTRTGAQWWAEVVGK